MARSLTARYEAAAPHWGRRLDWLGFPAAYREMATRVAEYHRFPEGQLQALDIGAGDGAFAQALAEACGPCLALTLLDPSPAMLKAAEARLGAGRARLITGTLESAGSATEGFDIVAAAHLLEHLPDPAAALARMAALTRPGGLVLLVVSQPHWCSRLVWLSWRHRRFHKAEMLGLLAGAGFADIRCWTLPPGPPRRLSLCYAAQRPVSGGMGAI